MEIYCHTYSGTKPPIRFAPYSPQRFQAGSSSTKCCRMDVCCHARHSMHKLLPIRMLHIQTRESSLCLCLVSKDDCFKAQSERRKLEDLPNLSCSRDSFSKIELRIFQGFSTNPWRSIKPKESSQYPCMVSLSLQI